MSSEIREIRVVLDQQGLADISVLEPMFERMFRTMSALDERISAQTAIISRLTDATESVVATINTLQGELAAARADAAAKAADLGLSKEATDEQLASIDALTAKIGTDADKLAGAALTNTPAAPAPAPAPVVAGEQAPPVVQLPPAEPVAEQPAEVQIPAPQPQPQPAIEPVTEQPQPPEVISSAPAPVVEPAPAPEPVAEPAPAPAPEPAPVAEPASGTPTVEPSATEPTP